MAYFGEKLFNKKVSTKLTVACQSRHFPKKGGPRGKETFCHNLRCNISATVQGWIDWWKENAS